MLFGSTAQCKNRIFLKMQTRYNKLFPANVWLTTIIAGSSILTIYDFLNRTDVTFGDIISGLSTLLLFNLIIGLPSLAIFFLGFNWIINLGMPTVSTRWILILLAFSLFLLTWLGINRLFERDAFFSAKSIFIYGDFLACLIAASFLYGKMPPVRPGNKRTLS